MKKKKVHTMVASEDFKKYFEEIEALRNYDRVKGERDELAKENLGLKDRVSELTQKNEDLSTKLDTEVEGRKKLDKKLKSETTRADGLDTELREKKSELETKVSELEVENEKHSNEINDLNSRLEGETKRREDAEKKLKSESKRADDLGKKLKSTSEELDYLKSYKIRFIDGKELTLEETKEALVEAHNDEIEKRADEKFQKLKSDYEARMPQLIHERLIQILKKPIWPVEIANVINVKAKEGADEKFQKLKTDYETKMSQLVYKRLVQILEKPLWPVEITDAINDKAKTIANGILQNGERWPSWFKKYYRKEVSTRLTELLDDEFNGCVNRKSQEVATRKLEILKSQAWPEWFSENVKPVIDKDVFKALGGLWTGWRCDKCGTGFEFTLAERDIGELLRNGGIDFLCPNANCVDYGLWKLRSWRHKVRITLERLIARMMERAEVTTAELVLEKKR